MEFVFGTQAFRLLHGGPDADADPGAYEKKTGSYCQHASEQCGVSRLLVVANGDGDVRCGNGCSTGARAMITETGGSWHDSFL